MEFIKRFATILASVALALGFVACEDPNEGTEPATEDNLTITITELTPFSVSYTIVAKEYDIDCGWYAFKPADEAITAPNLMKNGIALELNRPEKVYTNNNLTPGTDYKIVALVTRGDKMDFVTEEVTTPADDTPATVSIEVKSASYERVYFNITSAHCEDVWYAVVPHGAGEPDGAEDESDIIGGNRAKANCTVEMSVGDLNPETQYDIHAVACKPNSEGGRDEVRAEVVTFTTEAAPMVNTENTIEFQYGSYTRNDAEKYFTVTLQNDETNTVFSFEVHRYERWYDTYMGNYNYPRMSGTTLNIGEENKKSSGGGYDYVEVTYFKHNGIERTLVNNSASGAPYTLRFECMTNEYDLAEIEVTVIGDTDGNTFSFHYEGPIGYPLKDVDLAELNQDNIGNLTKLHLTEADGVYTLAFEGAMKSCQFQLEPANGTLAGSSDYKWYEVGSAEWIASGSWHMAFGGSALSFSGGKLGIQEYDNDANGNRRYKMAVENLQVKTNGDRDGDGQVDEGLEYMDIIAEPANGGDWIVTVQAAE